MSTDIGDNEMRAIERLAAHEGLDDNLEDIHAALSKRGAFRKSLSSHRSDAIATADGGNTNGSKVDVEEKGETRERGSRFSDRRSARSSRRSFEQDKQSKNANYSSERRRRRSDRRRGSRTDDSDDGRRVARSASAIQKLLEYNEDGNYSVISTETNQEKKSSMNPLLLGLSKSRDSGMEGKGGRSSHNRSTRSVNSRERRPKSTGRATSGTPRGGKRRSSSAAPSPTKSKTRKEDTPEQDPRQRFRGRRSTSHQGNSSNHQRARNGEQQDAVNRYIRSSKSLRTSRSYKPDPEPHQEQDASHDSFEKVWEKKITTDDLNQTNNSCQSISSSETDRDFSGGKLGQGTLGRSKKTKLEKIHELQGKCDRYKLELKAMVEERRKCLRELKEGREEASSLKNIVDANEKESTKLTSKVAELRDELETTRAEQRKERTELSEAAKDLARVNIDYAKSVDVARTLRESLDVLQGKLAERDEKISILEKELESSNENVRQLEADVLYADDQINKLEDEMKKMEKEVALYVEAANRDSLQDPNGDSDGTNLREAKYEAEKLKFEEREREIQEKSKILEEDMYEFQRQRTQHLEEQQQHERDFEEKQAREEESRAREEEKLKISDVDRREKDDEVKKRLNALDKENVALKGRLKSEQLDSTVKLQNKDNAIAELQTELARLTNEQKKRDSAPDSSPSLLLEIETLKTEVTKRRSDLEDVHMDKIELGNRVQDLQNVNLEITTRLSNLEIEIGEQKKEVESQRRKTLEWQKKTGEWSEKAVTWKQRSEHWEKKVKESNVDAASYSSDDAAQVEPQALFLAAAVEKKAANVSAANANGSWRLGRRIFGMASESEDETQALISNLEGNISLKENEIKTLKSEMVKMQTNYKEQAYSRAQEYEKLLKEKESIELKNANLVKELELARKLNRTMSESDI